MRPVRFLAAAAALLAFSASPAFAHDDAYLATQKAPNGGELRMAGPYHYELVADRASPAASGGAIVVYVTDHAGQPVSTQGAQGVAQVLAGKERSTVKLLPDGANRMKAPAPHGWASDAKVVVSITIAGAQPAQARFAPQPHAEAASTRSSDAGDGHGH
ncbi:MAG: hypothetical protein LT106_15395 [Burkholderiaceae bacterium]|nr:hypothetical protein [Burkholderiaceae bacterium]